MQLDAGHMRHALCQVRWRMPTDDHQLGAGFLRENTGENLMEKQADRVKIRPPIERAEEKNARRIASSLPSLQRGRGAGGEGDLFEVGAVDAVIDDIDIGLPELRADEPGVLLADGDNTRRLAERFLLEAAKLLPLRLEKCLLDEVPLGLVVAMSDRIDVMGNDDARSRDGWIDNRQIRSE